MEKKMVDQVIEKLDFSIHDLTSVLFDAMHIAQKMPVNGTTKKRIVLATMSRLVSRIKDEDELSRARVIVDTFPALIDMTITLSKSDDFNRAGCWCTCS